MPIRAALASCLALWAFAQSPTLGVDRNHHSFGKISPTTRSETRFTLKNTGQGPLIIQRVQASCGCTSAVIGHHTLKEGESTPLNVTFDSQDQQGPVRKSLGIFSNDPARPYVELTLEAHVVPPITTDPEVVAFRGVLPSDILHQKVRCASTRGLPLRFAGTADPLPPFLTITFEPEDRATTLTLTLTGAALPSSERSGQVPVRIRTNDPEMPVYTLPVLWSAGKALRLEPPAARFEPAPAGQAQQMHLALRHTKGRAFRILSVARACEPFQVQGLAGPAAPEHTIALCLGAGVPAGQYGGTLLLRTDSPDQPELEIQVLALRQ